MIDAAAQNKKARFLRAFLFWEGDEISHVYRTRHAERTQAIADLRGRCERRAPKGCGQAAQGCVAISSSVRFANASARDVPHIAGSGRKDEQTSGRSGWPNKVQRRSVSRCGQGMAAGLPVFSAGSGELIDGAMQHAAQAERQFMIGDLWTFFASSLGHRRFKPE